MVCLCNKPVKIFFLRAYLIFPEVLWASCILSISWQGVLSVCDLCEELFPFPLLWTWLLQACWGSCVLYWKRLWAVHTGYTSVFLQSAGYIILWTKKLLVLRKVFPTFCQLYCLLTVSSNTRFGDERTTSTQRPQAVNESWWHSSVSVCILCFSWFSSFTVLQDWLELCW